MARSFSSLITFALFAFLVACEGCTADQMNATVKAVDAVVTIACNKDTLDREEAACAFFGGDDRDKCLRVNKKSRLACTVAGK